MLLDVYIEGFYPDNPFKYSWESPPNPAAYVSNLAHWYFEPQNQPYAHFRQAREHVLEYMHKAVHRHFPDCGEKQLKRIEMATLAYFYVDDSERFQALLVLGATQKKAARDYFGGVAEGIRKLDPTVIKKGARGYWIN